MAKTVFVVMGNDYPAGVFDSEDKAKAYIKKRQARDRADDKLNGRPDYGSPRIYWRFYGFELNGETQL